APARRRRRDLGATHPRRRVATNVAARTGGSLSPASGGRLGRRRLEPVRGASSSRSLPAARTSVTPRGSGAIMAVETLHDWTAARPAGRARAPLFRVAADRSGPHLGALDPPDPGAPLGGPPRSARAAWGGARIRRRGDPGARRRRRPDPRP